jgi:RNA polymerase sigma factor (TIGR02999 family)
MSEFVLEAKNQPLLSQISTELQASLSAQLQPRYAQLKLIASRERSRLGYNPTLNTTALVHELFLKFARNESSGLENPAHFLALCAVAMRNLLVDDARRRGRAQDYARSIPEADYDECGHMLALNDALERMAEIEPRLARVVECRWFAGYTEIETAHALGVSDRTVRRDWEKAQLWLQDALAP